MNNNLLTIAAAGSGKTTYLIDEALNKDSSKKILITTYTEANEKEIRKKIIKKKGYIPSNITVQTWFSFLLQHGVRPFQGSINSILFNSDIKGMILVNQKSGVKYQGKFGSVIYKEDTEFEKHYFTKSWKIYSDKISKFAVTCDDASNGNVIDRISKIYSHILVDEVQDLAGYDLEILKFLFKTKTFIFLVGDPRQVTYLTHIESKYKKYRDGRIKDFVSNELGKKVVCEIDENTLKVSHRNNKAICDFSVKLFPEFPKIEPCNCETCRNYSIEHEGVFIIKTANIEEYIEKFKPIQLRWSRNIEVSNKTNVYNFGESKGLTFNRVLLYPTSNMIEWIKDNNYNFTKFVRGKEKKLEGVKDKFYVAITRAKYSVAIVFDYDETKEYDEIIKYNENQPTNILPNRRRKSQNRDPF
ncbi:MAG: UvrD-helicase domain-containing protein [Bacteroidetes bacterium]|jgi:DNA helicase II / ATP-dependent DNA helicase PcrA|nr:UvrD-helicase domain-containing protein [Bacteroidota bacterium]MBT6687919.1 UvrD-helicase domain-containing protein [Bacteroidota bacterium]MBT7142433.1 UvrD-helicase domain-containing protein [Bacteroidota bacterium]MBT7490060.1 UvrD-helicase domain-containing protein [Bacteroidota bacterium]